MPPLSEVEAIRRYAEASKSQRPRPARVRHGLVMRAGDYPDKGVAITEGDLRRMAATLRYAPIDLEHLPSALDGELGWLVGVQQVGADLHGTAVIPEWLDDTIGADPLKVSLELGEDMAITKMAICNYPRVDDAALLRVAFSRERREMEGNNNEGTKTLEEFGAFMRRIMGMGRQEPEPGPAQFSDSERAKFAAEIGELRQEHERLAAEARQAKARAFADRMILVEKRALPSQGEAIIQFHMRAAALDASNPPAEGENSMVGLLEQTYSQVPPLAQFSGLEGTPGAREEGEAQAKEARAQADRMLEGIGFTRKENS